jgi:ribosomal protein S18 acetylase RimI-like enzyme
VRIRRATIDDAGVLAAFARRTFDETFAAQNDPGKLTAFLDSTYGAEQQREELEDPGWVTLFAEEDGELSGFVQVRDGPPPPCVATPAPLELGRLYVDRRWQGAGIAGALMEGAVAVAIERGARSLWLGVWEENPRAIAFYRRRGFDVVGEQVFTLGGDPQTDWVMVRLLDGR